MTSRQGDMSERDLFGARPHEYEVPEYVSHVVPCRSCGKPMIFIRTDAGKAMPLSAATIEMRDGKRFALPHWADCAQAKEWSKKR